MDEVEQVQRALDTMAESITALGKDFALEKMMYGGLSEESEEQLAAAKIAALKTKLLLLEHGVPLRNEESA